MFWAPDASSHVDV